jgi:hypothetical protein
MTTLLRFALAFGVAGAFVLAAADTAEAKSKRGTYKKPRYHAYVVRPYAGPPGPPVSETQCVTQYDSRGVPLPAYMYCDAAFRRLYSR